MNAAPKPPSRGLAHDFGLARPPCGWWSWCGDPQVQAALLAALPVCALLAAAVGDRMAAPPSALAWLSLVLLQPVAEEFVFRGMLQGQLLRLSGRHWPGGLSTANLLSSAAFGAAHLFTQPPAWALATVLPSMVFGHLRERFASLLPAVALHAAYNAMFGLFAWSLGH